MKISISFAVATMVLVAMGASSRAQVIDVTQDGTPIIGLAISDAAIAAGQVPSGGGLPPNPSNYGYSTNGEVSGGMLRGGNTDGKASDFPGTYTSLVDGNPNTYADTEYDGYGPPDPLGYYYGSAYVGMTGLGTVSALHPVTTLKLSFYLDLYGQAGSYFGDNGTGDVYQNGGTGDYYVHLPSTLTLYMQVTTDGTNWTDVPFTTDYATVMNNFDVGSDPGTAVFGPTATFTLDNLSDGENIQGIRVIGTVGGGRDDGMLGLSDILVETPEPSTYALVGLGMAGLFVLGRFVRRARA